MDSCLEMGIFFFRGSYLSNISHVLRRERFEHRREFEAFVIQRVLILYGRS